MFVPKLRQLRQFKFLCEALGGNKGQEILWDEALASPLSTQPELWCKQFHMSEAWDIGERERGRGLQDRKTNQHLFQVRCSVMLRDTV